MNDFYKHYSVIQQICLLYDYRDLPGCILILNVIELLDGFLPREAYTRTNN